MKKVTYHQAAELELLDAVGYLELRRKGLGRRFLGEIRKSEDFIAQFPQAAEEIRPGIRKRPLAKFRYALIYSPEHSGIAVTTKAGGRSLAPFAFLARDFQSRKTVVLRYPSERGCYQRRRIRAVADMERRVQS